MTPRPARVLLGVEQALFAQALRNFLEPQFRIVGIAASGGELFQVAARERPDVIVTDVELPGFGGPTGLHELCALCPESRLVVITECSTAAAGHERRRGHDGHPSRAARGADPADDQRPHRAPGAGGGSRRAARGPFLAHNDGEAASRWSVAFDTTGGPSSNGAGFVVRAAAASQGVPQGCGAAPAVLPTWRSAQASISA